MNKHRELAKRTAKTAIGAAVVAAISVAAYVGVSVYASSVEKQMNEAKTKVTSDESLLANLKSQLDKSGEAEKRFLTLQERRTSQNFSTNLEGLFEFLREAKTRYRFDKFTVGKPPREVPSDKQELANFAYNIMLRPLKFEFKAVSDLHVFSFIDELRYAAPGMIRVDFLSLKRGGTDMTDATISTLNSGQTPILVDAKLDITWITITPKERKADAKAEPKPPGTP